MCALLPVCVGQGEPWAQADRSSEELVITELVSFPCLIHNSSYLMEGVTWGCILLPSGFKVKTLHSLCSWWLASGYAVEFPDSGKDYAFTHTVCFRIRFKFAYILYSRYYVQAGNHTHGEMVVTVEEIHIHALLSTQWNSPNCVLMMSIQAYFILYHYVLYPVTYLVISDIKSRDLFRFCLLLP